MARPTSGSSRHCGSALKPSSACDLGGCESERQDLFFPKKGRIMMTDPTYSANEAACITGVPLKQVHRFIDAGMIEADARRGDKRVRAVPAEGLVCLKLAHETSGVLTLEGRRRLVRSLVDHPGAESASAHCISVDLAPMRGAVQNGLALLAKARDAVSCDSSVLSGTPCIKGTRIPAHDVADMLANGDSVEALRNDFPQLTTSKNRIGRSLRPGLPQAGPAAPALLACAKAALGEQGRVAPTTRHTHHTLI